jgi:glycosyltransferase involved in cell wall biosynthesis
MRIGYEAKRAFLNRTGLGNYSRGVIKAMAAYYPHNHYFVYTPKIGAANNAAFIKGHQNITVVTPQSSRFTSLWRSKFVINDLKKARIEVYHGLSHEIPFGINQAGIKAVVTIHDLIFKHFPQYFGFFSRQIYSAKIKYACKHAGKIIAISERTKLDLVDLLNVDPQKIEVIYQDCDEQFKIPQSQQNKLGVKQQYNLPDNYILSIGTIEERKNLLVLVKALKQLPTDTRLVVIGKPTQYAAKVKQYITDNNLSQRVQFISNVSFAHLPAIYQQAQLFVYPSRYEGFGIPILEALVSSVPVIAATGSCLEEAGGPDSLYVNPDDENDLAGKIKLVLANDQLQKQMIAKGLIYAQKFENKLLSNQLMQLYINLVNHA